MPGSLPPALRAFARDLRGSASIELALGAVALVATLAACFDLYSRIRADTAGARAAVVMAEYVAGATAPDGDEMAALGGFLFEHELAVPANLVYVVSAFRQPPGDPPPALALLWSDDTVRIGDATVTAELAGACPRFIDENGVPALPDGFTMAEGEVLVVAEVCAQLTREGSLTGRFVSGGHLPAPRDPGPGSEPAAGRAGVTPGDAANGRKGRAGVFRSFRARLARHDTTARHADGGHRRGRMTLYRFLRDAHGGATGIAAAAVTVMTVGGAALVGDHAWLVDQRDVLKTGTDAAAVAVTLEMTRRLGRQPDLSDADLDAALEAVAHRYVEVNLRHLPAERLARARDTLVVEVSADREQGTVEVEAEADLGGFLFASRLPLLGNDPGPDAIRVDAGVECTTNVVEVVLALDITASMNGRIDGNGGDGDENHRLKVAIEAAKALVNVLYSGCNEVDLAVGVVPWDKAVRLDDPEAWRTNGWADMSPYRSDPEAAEGDWAGCVEDRVHDLADLKTSGGLSLALPREASFPAFLYPDTSRLDPAVVTDMRERVFDAFPAVADTLTPAEVETRLLARGDNNWSDPLDDPSGPNFQCTGTAMLPLTSDSEDVITRLEALDDRGLWGGSTSAHVGVTWGRRMLASTWREVWGGRHPPGGSFRIPAGRGDEGPRAPHRRTERRDRPVRILAGRDRSELRRRHPRPRVQAAPGCRLRLARGQHGHPVLVPRKAPEDARGSKRGRVPLSARRLLLGRPVLGGPEQVAPEGLQHPHAALLRARARGRGLRVHGVPPVLDRGVLGPGLEEQHGRLLRDLGGPRPARSARPSTSTAATRRRSPTRSAPSASASSPCGASTRPPSHHHSSKETTAMHKTRTRKHISRRLRRFAWANEAVSALEYALVVGVVATVIAAALVTFGGEITDLLDTIGGRGDRGPETPPTTSPGA